MVMGQQSFTQSNYRPQFVNTSPEHLKTSQNISKPPPRSRGGGRGSLANAGGGFPATLVVREPQARQAYRPYLEPSPWTPPDNAACTQLDSEKMPAYGLLSPLSSQTPAPSLDLPETPRALPTLLEAAECMGLEALHEAFDADTVMRLPCPRCKRTCMQPSQAAGTSC